MSIAIILSGLACFLLPVHGEGAAPTKLSEVAPVEDLATEVKAKLVLVDGYLKDDQTFSDSKEKLIPQSAGVLAVLGQAIAEHEEKSKVQVSGADLRDAAHKIVNSKSRNEAIAALEQAKEAAAGKQTGAAVEHEWNKLINLHSLMEEVNLRNSSIRRVLRRSRDPQTDSLHATTLAVLALVIEADTHEVKNPADLSEWRKHAKDVQSHMTAVSAAIKQKDSKTGNARFLQANKSCVQCHTHFRIAEPATP
jgi:hypothetical protein